MVVKGPFLKVVSFLTEQTLHTYWQKTDKGRRKKWHWILSLLFQREFENDFQETVEATFAKENEWSTLFRA